MITHVVLLDVDGPDGAATQRILAGLQGLPDRIDCIREWDVGADVLQSERSYDLALVATFDDLDALEEYRMHPAHQEVVAVMRESGAITVVVDFESS